MGFNYDKVQQNCFLLKDLGAREENPLFLTGPKTCRKQTSKDKSQKYFNRSFNEIQFKVGNSFGDKILCDKDQNCLRTSFKVTRFEMTH